jgi:hypothetical protein
LSFYEGVGVGLLKIEESESELLCTDSTALLAVLKFQVLLQSKETYGFGFLEVKIAGI